MQIEAADLLHPSLLDDCLKLYQGGHFKHAALEAMTLVELALREKGVAPERAFGVKLVRETFGRSSHIMLTVELDEQLQNAARTLFEGAFSFYRNYAAHDGRRLDQKTAFRVMVLASELLDLLGAARLSFTRLGGLEGLLAHRLFAAPAELANCLRFLDGNSFPDTAMDGFWEDQATAGVDDRHIETALDLGLIEAKQGLYTHHVGKTEIEEIVTVFELTELGGKVLAQAEANCGTLGT